MTAVEFDDKACRGRLLLPCGEKDGMRGLRRRDLGTWEFQLNLPNPSPQPSPYGRGSSPRQLLEQILIRRDHNRLRRRSSDILGL